MATPEQLRILDTTAISALMRGDRAAVDTLEALGRSSVLVPQPVVAEVEYGLARLRESKRRDRLRARFDLLLGELLRCEWTDEVSQAFGRIKSSLEARGTPLEDFDIAIAAHALANKAVLVSANLRHMARVEGLDVEDWGPRQG